MSNRPTVLLAQTISITGALTIYAEDEHTPGGRTVTVVPAATTRHYRVLLGAGAGTSIDLPGNLLARVEAALNADPPTPLWECRLDPSGAVSLRYTGTGAALLVLPTLLQRVLGHGATVAYTGAGVVISTRAPNGVIVAVCASDDDSDWQWSATGVAASESQRGAVVALDSTHRRLSRSLTLRMLPYTAAEMLAGERLTPAYPPRTTAAASRWTAPASDAATTVDGYSALEFVATAQRSSGARIGAAIGTLQQLLDGSAPVFDECWIAAETLRGGDLTPLSVPGWYARRDLQLRLNLATRRSL